ncbi:hypothetical protein BDY21DRAFT_357980 [Lineolata rhizophorae]|uniref:Uncharacterized protein n=1 Tax=Lineolata rhizophorae TaxID=578093 RepID=A0A6A6NM41_9PEZI|nr:hypothetical protein BDY21DRAFT_357980 [Lineolata rhizophorae]
MRMDRWLRGGEGGMALAGERRVMGSGEGRGRRLHHSVAVTLSERRRWAGLRR